jgi:hypothetical protein
MLVSYLAYYSTLKMAASHVPPKRQLTFRRTTWRYIPEDRTLENADVKQISIENFLIFKGRTHNVKGHNKDNLYPSVHS